MVALEVLLQFRHVYSLCLSCWSISRLVCSWLISPDGYSIIISAISRLSYLSSSSSSGISGCLAMSCVTSVFSACLANLHLSYPLFSSGILRSCSCSCIAWFRSSHCAFSSSLGMGNFVAFFRMYLLVVFRLHRHSHDWCFVDP